MDMDFSRGKQKPQLKKLPGFRAGSEIPAHSEEVASDPIAAAFTAPNTDPTDLTLDRERASAGFEEPLPQVQPPKEPKMKRRTSKKQLFIMLGLLLAVVLATGGWLGYQKFVASDDEQPNIVQGEVKKEDKPKTKPAPITGREVLEEVAARPTTAIMIENSLEARPQSGLLEADMVVEAIAEGGITRFVALYQEGQPELVGPIRSARPYYVEVAKTFDAAYVHAGGSPDALALIPQLDVKDMSAFENNGTYTRVDFRDAPHDLYSSMQKLDARRNELGFTTSTFTPWAHKEDTPQTPTASNIDVRVSSELYNPSYTYDIATNSYKRIQNGTAHTDYATSTQLNPKVVVVLVTSKGQDGQYSTYRLTGTGSMIVFQDGIVSQGTWSKESASAQFSFTDKNGLDFVFNKGQLWMTLVGNTGDVSYTP